MKEPIINALVLPGGKIPVQGRLHDGGFDAYIRAIVEHHFDDNVKGMKRTIWDFQGPPPSSLEKNATFENGIWKYLLHHGERPIFLGLGVIFGGLTTDWIIQTTRRSKAAFRQLRLHDYLEEVIIDPTWRGESMMYITNDNPDEPLEIYRDSSYTQFTFDLHDRGFVRPVIKIVTSYDELGIPPERGLAYNGTSDPKNTQTAFQF